MRKFSIKSLCPILASLGAIAITSCGSGSTTNNNYTNNNNFNVCTYPAFTDATAQALLTSWGKGLQYYYTNPTESDFYVNAGYFTMTFYTPDAILQPTVSPEQRYGTQQIYNYFVGFMAANPIMSFNPESNIAVPLDCGYGGYVGYYDFVTESGTPYESTTHARFTFVYQYMPNTFSESFTVESGPESGTTYTQQNPGGRWYINIQHSSILPTASY